MHADVLVHFGHSPVDEQPGVIYEPYKIDFDVGVLEKALPFFRGETVGLVTTVQHVHLIPAMELFLRAKGISCSVAEGSGRTPNRGQVLGCSFAAAKGTPAGMILFVGTGLFHPIGIALATHARVIALDPLTGICTGSERGRTHAPSFCGHGKSQGCKKRGNHCQHQERPAEDGSCPPAGSHSPLLP